MPQYAVISYHGPSECPLNNKAVREWAVTALPKLPEIAEKLGVKILLNVHLDPAHKALMLCEGPSAEAVRDMLFTGGWITFTNMELYLVTPLEELLKRANEFPMIYQG